MAVPGGAPEESLIAIHQAPPPTTVNPTLLQIVNDMVPTLLAKPENATPAASAGNADVLLNFARGPTPMNRILAGRQQYKERLKQKALKNLQKAKRASAVAGYSKTMGSPNLAEKEQAAQNAEFAAQRSEAMSEGYDHYLVPPACPTFEQVVIRRELPVVQELGRGAFGVVVNLDNRYVLKQVKLKSPEYLRLFIQEANLLHELTKIPELQPYLPRFCWTAVQRDWGYILQEYEEVMTLDTLIEQFKQSGHKIRFDMGFSLLQHLLLGFSALWRHGVIHRDIKTSNLLVRTSTTSPYYFIPIIIDFGLACKEPCTERTFHGTPVFMPGNWIPKRYQTRTFIEQYLNTSVQPPRKFSKMYRARGDPLKHPTSEKLTVIQTRKNRLRPKYSEYSDQFLLQQVLGSIRRLIDWSGHQTELEAIIKDERDMVRRQTIELAAEAGRSRLRAKGFEPNNAGPNLSVQPGQSFFRPNINLGANNSNINSNNGLALPPLVKRARPANAATRKRRRSRKN
jgi:serine/threonine protein kinase